MIACDKRVGLRGRGVAALIAIALALVSAGPAAGDADPESEPSRGAARRVAPAVRQRMPLHFERNLGQTHESVQYLVRARGYVAYFTGDETVFALAHGTPAPVDEPAPRGAAVDVVRMRFVGSAAPHKLAGQLPLPGRSHYLIGDDPGAWVRDVPHFETLAASEIAPGVDARWRTGKDGHLTYDLVVAPGADPQAVAIRFEGAESLEIEAGGALRIETPSGAMRHSAPVLFQDVDGQRIAVRGGFDLRAPDSVGFRVGKYDRRRPLVIDPSITYSSLIGGTELDISKDVDVDASGNSYFVGYTKSTDFPTSSAAYQTEFAGGNVPYDTCVAKISASGSLAYSTYIGGTSDDYGMGMATGSGGVVHVAGYSWSSNFPTVSAYQSTKAAKCDVFVLTLNSAGSSLTYSTYLGGSEADFGVDVAVDSSGARYVCGQTNSTDFPTQAPVQSTHRGGLRDAFVAKLSSNGGSLAYSTYLGGTARDGALQMALRNGEAYVVGQTASSNFPTAAPASSSPVQSTYGGGSYDGFVTKLNASGSAWVYSTFLGGTAMDLAQDIDVDGDGNAYVVGTTISTDFPTTTGAYQTALGGTSSARDAFVTKLNSSGGSAVYSTYLGGGGNENHFAQEFAGIAVDGDGVAHVVGSTNSTDFPLKRAIQSTVGEDSRDAFLSRLNAEGTALVLSTYLGGESGDAAAAVAVDSDGCSHIVGTTSSLDFPAESSLYTYAGNSDYFLARISASVPPEAPDGLTATVLSDRSVSLSWTDESHDETGLELERAVGDGAFGLFAELAPGVEAIEDTTTTGGTTYDYRVRAVNEIGPSEWSDVASATTPSPAPTGVSGSSTSSSAITITWSDDADDETGYVIERATGCPGVNWSVLAVLPPNTTSYTDRAVAAETTYAYRVRTQGAHATSTPSLEICVLTGPAKPSTLLAITQSDTGVLLRWPDSSAIETAYEIERTMAGGVPDVIAAAPRNTVEHVDATVAPETAYEYRVRTVAANGRSGWSPRADARTAPAAPSEPFGEAVSSSRVRLTWIDNSSVENGFEVRRRIHSAETPSELVARLSPNSTSFLDDGLLQETGYDYTVNAYDSAGDSNSIGIDDLETTAVLVIRKVKLKAAKKKKPAKMTVNADIDFGGYQPDAADGATLGINDTDFTTATLELKKEGRVLSHKGDDYSFKLTRKSPIASRGSLKITVTGPGAEIDGDSELTIAFTTGDFTAAGSITLDEKGRFDLKKHLGRRVDPDVVPSKLKLTLGGPENDKLLLTATFEPWSGLPDEIPNALVTVGDTRLVFAGVSADEDESRLRVTYALTGIPQATLTIDYARGTVKLKASKLELGDYPTGASPTLLDVIIGELRWRDVPVLYRKGKRANY